MARRLRSVIKDQLYTCQFYGVPGNFPLEAASLVRDAIAYLVIRITPLCTYSRYPTRISSYIPSLPLSNLTPIWHQQMVHRETTRPTRKRHGLGSN